MEALNNYVFLEWEKEKQTKKGIILADASKSRPAMAKVAEVGPGIMDKNGNFVKTNLKKGDIVVVDPFLLRQIKVDDKDYLVVKENEILARI